MCRYAHLGLEGLKDKPRPSKQPSKPWQLIAPGYFSNRLWRLRPNTVFAAELVVVLAIRNTIPSLFSGYLRDGAIKPLLGNHDDAAERIRHRDDKENRHRYRACATG